MNDDVTPPKPESPAPDGPDWKTRKRLAAVFGDVLPETTDDERDTGGSGDADEEAQDRWLRGQVPPHHG